MTTFSHFGICVSDLDRSLRFYCEGLGFQQVQGHDVGDEFGPLMELAPVQLRSRMVRRDGVTVELLCFDQPGHVGDQVRRPMNELGLTHLSFSVDDLEATAAGIEAVGGAVVRGTRTTFDVGTSRFDFVYCTDPDGVRIELMDLAGTADGPDIGTDAG